MAWDSPELFSIQPGPGPESVPLCLCRRNRSVRAGRENFGRKNQEGMPVATGNPSREAILARIREGLRTPGPPMEDKTFYGPIFEAVVNPLERFQQECKANLMECHLTADAGGSAQALAEVLQSLPPGEIFIQDDPALRRLMSDARS